MSVFQALPPVKKTLALSFGIERAIIQALSEMDEVTEPALQEAIRSGFGLVYSTKLVEENISALVTAVLSRIEYYRNRDDTPKEIKISRSKTLGTGYADWLSQLDGSQICLYLANYDPAKAYHMYWHDEIRWVEEAVRTRSKQDSELGVLRMEAVMYGMGGHYTGDTASSKGETFDLNSGQGVDLLKQLGF